MREKPKIGLILQLPATIGLNQDLVRLTGVSINNIIVGGLCAVRIMSVGHGCSLYRICRLCSYPYYLSLYSGSSFNTTHRTTDMWWSYVTGFKMEEPLHVRHVYILSVVHVLIHVSVGLGEINHVFLGCTPVE